MIVNVGSKQQQQLLLIAVDMSLREYCQQTSLHGWFYCTTTENRLWKALWSLIVLTSIGVASIFIYKATEEFTKATVETTIHSTTVPLTEVFFPAVTVCNINQVRRSGRQQFKLWSKVCNNMRCCSPASTAADKLRVSSRSSSC